MNRFDAVQRRQAALKKFNQLVEDVVISKGAQEYEFTAEAIFGALGPVSGGYAILEKGIRYAKQGKPIDLVKAAAYAFLAWSVTEEAAHD